MLMSKFFSKRWAPALLIVLCTFLVWGNSVRSGFVWDDYLFIVDNTSLRSLKNVPEMFCSEAAQHAISQNPCPMLRPLRTVHFALLQSLGGKDTPQPWIFHLANVLWHSLAALLVYSVTTLLLCRKTGPDDPDLSVAKGIAFITALAFALNPVVSEVVCWSKALDDIMATVFVLAALRSLLKYQGKAREYWMALAWFTAALYSKESVVTFPLVALLVFRLVHGLPWKRTAALVSGFVGVSGAYMFHRFLVVGDLAQCPPLSGSQGQTLLDMMPVIPKYLRLLLGIPPFCIDYGYMSGHCNLLSGEVLLGMLVLVLYFGAAVWAWRKRPLVFLGMAWVGAFLLPVSNLVSMMQFMAERFLYLPLVGFLLVLAILVSRLRQLRWAGGISIMVLLVWSQASVDRSAIWHDELSLFAYTWQESPHCRRLEKNMVIAIFRLPHMRKLFPIDPNTGQMKAMQIGSAQDIEAAIQTLRESHRLIPENVVVISALGLACSQAGYMKEASELLELSAKSEPSVQHFQNLGSLQLELGQDSAAKVSLEQALQLDPTNRPILLCYSQLCGKLQDYGKALDSLKTVQKSDPQDKELSDWLEELERKKLRQELKPSDFAPKKRTP